jgi:ADP-ribosylglycohydrolase
MDVRAPSSDRRLGCLFGLAFGDALGAETEFLSINEIRGRWPPDGPRELSADLILVTDDTQMTIAVAEALAVARAKNDLSPETLERELRKTFVDWFRSPDNTRAPGNTCLSAAGRLEAGAPWIEATVIDSKGCGANMRVAPVGLLPAAAEDSNRAAIAQFQAALTHGHPTALAASDLTAFAIAYLAEGGGPSDLLATLRNYAEAQSRVYHGDWLELLWQRAGATTPNDFIEFGWAECLQALDRVRDAVRPEKVSKIVDPCLQTGAGWVAEEALATALLCFLMYPDQPQEAIHRAAFTSGDSDSIACLAGAFAGAHLGIGCWPDDWTRGIEYRDRLEDLALRLG